MAQDLPDLGLGRPAMMGCPNSERPNDLVIHVSDRELAHLYAFRIR